MPFPEFLARRRRLRTGWVLPLLLHEGIFLIFELEYRMLVAVMILMLSIAMFFFYLQTICLKILRQEFDRDYFLPIVNANRLEFPAVQRAVEEFDAPVDYHRFCMMLKCDFLALSYLLKNAGNESHRYSTRDRLLVLYFHLTYFFLHIRHVLRMDEKTPILRLTSVLKFFGNVIGLRVNSTRFRDISASDYLLTL